MVKFQAAMALTGAEFSEAVQYYAKVGAWAVHLWYRPATRFLSVVIVE
jgi:hypothetical protein